MFIRIYIYTVNYKIIESKMRFIQIKYINFIFDILEYSTILPSYFCIFVFPLHLYIPNLII